MTPDIAAQALAALDGTVNAEQAKAHLVRGAERYDTSAYQYGYVVAWVRGKLASKPSVAQILESLDRGAEGYPDLSQAEMAALCVKAYKSAA